jgi:hypothetical protein
MSIGLLSLVSIGKENLYFSGLPEITFFKVAYKRYTNYAIEPTPQFFKTTPDFGRRCSINIGKNADLLGMSYLYVKLPDIQIENFVSNSSTLKKFSWVEKIGIALINFIEIEIGGNFVDRHYGDWINIWNELTISMGIKNGYNKMIGNIEELSSQSQSKISYILYIPLSFWFCLDSGLALPLVSLLNNDVKIHVEFNDIDKCYKISPSYFITTTNNFCLYTKGELFYQNYENTKIVGEFVYFDPVLQRIYYNPIKGKFNIPKTTTQSISSQYKLIGNESNFETNIKINSVVVKDDDYFKFNKPSLAESYLLVNYIYLDNYERSLFQSNSNEYIIPIVHTLPDQTAYSTNVIYKLPLYNPTKLIVWRAMLLSNYNSNDLFNYTASPYTDLLTNISDNIIKNELIYINSKTRMGLDNYSYYTLLQNYQNLFKTTQKGIHTYSFALHPLELQPSGTLNFSKIDDAYIQLTLNSVINYQNPAVIKAYSINYNLFRTNNGVGGLGFNN